MVITGTSKRCTAGSVDVFTANPPAGAGPLMRAMTLPYPPCRITVWRPRLDRTGALIRTTRLLVTPRYDADTVTFVSAATGSVLTVMVFSVCTAATVVLPGTLT